MPLPWLIAGGVAAGVAGLAALLSDDDEKAATNVTKKASLSEDLKEYEELKDGLIEVYNEVNSQLDQCIAAEKELLVRKAIDKKIDFNNDLDLAIYAETMVANSDDLDDFIAGVETIYDDIQVLKTGQIKLEGLANRTKSIIPVQLTVHSISKIYHKWLSLKEDLEVDETKLYHFAEKYAENQKNIAIRRVQAVLDNLELEINQTNLIKEKVDEYIAMIEADEVKWYQFIKEGNVNNALQSFLNEIERLDKRVKKLEIKMDNLKKEVYSAELNIFIEEHWGDAIEQYDKNRETVLLTISTFRGKCERLLEERPIYTDSDKVSIAVIAPMSSGKSTLVNAILGKELLPSKNEACTAVITTIVDDDGAEYFTAELLDHKEKLLKEIKNVSAEDLDNFNNMNDVSEIRLKGDIKSIRADNRILEIIDTPGPNNANNALHGETTQTLLEQGNFHIVLYVLNATQLGINDDYRLLHDVVQLMKQEQYSKKEDRILFVLNKCDELDPEDGETIENIILYVKKYLQEHGFDTPHIFPVSAMIARLIRQKQNGESLTRKENREYSAYVEGEMMQPLERYAEIPHALNMALKRQLELAMKYGDRDMIALIHTGIPSLEMMIENML